jgi:hydroxyacylglutathione hydrolase
MNYRRVNSPLFRSLFAQGLVSAGPRGGGFQCAGNGAMIDANGRVSETLFNLGPGRLGTLLESIAVPEIRHQAVQLAEILNQKLTRRTDKSTSELRLVDTQPAKSLPEAAIA